MKTTLRALVRWITWISNRNAVRKVLMGKLRSLENPKKGRFLPSDVDRVLDQAQHNVNDLLLFMPEYKTLGNYQWVFGGLISLAIYRALLNEKK